MAVLAPREVLLVLFVSVTTLPPVWPVLDRPDLSGEGRMLVIELHVQIVITI